ncbi:MAG: hypothetical protein OER86_14500 [Phycisphaerae bacterium]|nr:hypothetical protein [Phycisphaerae bacterium]
MRTTQSLIVAGLLVCFVAVMWASGAVAPRGPERMKKDASHVVVGKIRDVYVHQETVKEFGGSETRTTYLSMLKIESVEKGAGVAKDEVAYMKTWEHKWNGPGTPPTYPSPENQDRTP